MDWPFVIAIFTAIFGGVGLFLNWSSVRINTQTREVELLNRVFENLQSLTKLFYDKYKKKKDKEERKQWDDLFFNSLERFSFLVNQGFIRDKRLVGFFEDAIVNWYEELFMQPENKEEFTDPKTYPEFKHLYLAIKSRKEKRNMKGFIGWMSQINYHNSFFTAIFAVIAFSIILDVRKIGPYDSVLSFAALILYLLIFMAVYFLGAALIYWFNSRY